MSDQQPCPHQLPLTPDWHVFNVGMLIGNLQSLEFIARAAIADLTGAQWGADLRTAQPGDSVSEGPMTNYDQLASVLKRFNSLAKTGRQLDVDKLVDSRDQLAHGRVAAIEPRFPLVLLKFGKPVGGRVQVLARIEMNEEWFATQRRFVHDSIQIVGDEVMAWRLDQIR